MKPFNKCPVCGGELRNKKVEKLLRGGGNTASLKVFAEVCLHCGERLYPEDVVKTFEKIRLKLQKNEFDQLVSTGKSYTVDESWSDKDILPTYTQGVIDV
jgi:YgiT-type zinc finger domain-containing protein